MLNIQAKLKNSFLLSQDETTEITRSASQQAPSLNDMKASGLKLEASKSVSANAFDLVRSKYMVQTNIEKYSHLLIGKVRDTQIIFSFFIEASIIDVDLSQAASLAT